MHCQIRCSRTNYENKWDVPLVFMEEDSLSSTWGGGGGRLLFCQWNKVSGCVCMCGSVCVHVCRCGLNMSEQSNLNAVCRGLGHILFCVPASAVTASLHVINSSVQKQKMRKKKSESERERERERERGEEAEGEDTHVRSQLHVVC